MQHRREQQRNITAERGRQPSRSLFIATGFRLAYALSGPRNGGRKRAGGRADGRTDASVSENGTREGEEESRARLTGASEPFETDGRLAKRGVTKRKQRLRAFRCSGGGRSYSPRPFDEFLRFALTE